MMSANSDDGSTKKAAIWKAASGFLISARLATFRVFRRTIWDWAQSYEFFKRSKSDRSFRFDWARPRPRLDSARQTTNKGRGDRMHKVRLAGRKAMRAYPAHLLRIDGSICPYKSRYCLSSPVRELSQVRSIPNLKICTAWESQRSKHYCHG
jgi:hypothetical protein